VHCRSELRYQLRPPSELGRKRSDHLFWVCGRLKSWAWPWAFLCLSPSSLASWLFTTRHTDSGIISRASCRGSREEFRAGRPWPHEDTWDTLGDPLQMSIVEYAKRGKRKGRTLRCRLLPHCMEMLRRINCKQDIIKTLNLEDTSPEFAPSRLRDREAHSLDSRAFPSKPLCYTTGYDLTGYHWSGHEWSSQRRAV